MSDINFIHHFWHELMMTMRKRAWMLYVDVHLLTWRLISCAHEHYKKINIVLWLVLKIPSGKSNGFNFENPIHDVEKRSEQMLKEWLKKFVSVQLNMYSSWCKLWAWEKSNYFMNWYFTFDCEHFPGSCNLESLLKPIILVWLSNAKNIYSSHANDVGVECIYLVTDNQLSWLRSQVPLLSGAKLTVINCNVVMHLVFSLWGGRN